MDNNVTITKIEASDRDDHTQVVDLIHLSDGTAVSAWNGNASYRAHDEARGRVETGATLARVEDAENHQGESYKVYTFV